MQVCGMIHQHRLQLPTDVYANLLIYAVQHGSNSTDSFESSHVLHFLSILQQNTVNWSALLSSTDKSRLCAILLEQKAWHELLDIAIVWLDQPKVCLCPSTNLSTYSIAAPKLALQSVCMQVCQPCSWHLLSAESPCTTNSTVTHACTDRRSLCTA